MGATYLKVFCNFQKGNYLVILKLSVTVHSSLVEILCQCFSISFDVVVVTVF